MNGWVSYNGEAGAGVDIKINTAGAGGGGGNPFKSRRLTSPLRCRMMSFSQQKRIRVRFNFSKMIREFS